MLRSVATVLATFAVIYIALCAIVFLFQRSMIYYPQFVRPAEEGQAFTMQVDGAAVQIVNRPAPGAQALIYFGGNAEDVTASLPLLADAFPDHALYLMVYRGYGGSTGSPGEDALHADALALFERVSVRHSQVSVIGRSLGAAVALRLASIRPVHRLVLVTPFDSLQALAERQFPWLPVRWLLRDKYLALDDAPKVHAPATLVVAARDEIVPPASAKRLLARFPEGVARMIVIAGASHNDLSSRPEYRRALRDGKVR